MITKQQAMTHRGEFHHVTAKDSRGAPLRCRPMGRCKTWVTRPVEFKLPVKFGLYDSFYITERNADQWSLPGEQA